MNPFTWGEFEIAYRVRIDCSDICLNVPMVFITIYSILKFSQIKKSRHQNVLGFVK